MAKIINGPPCLICGSPSKARNFCEMHYSRWIRHGHAEQTRPVGWGRRSSHPLKDSWCNTLKCIEGRVPRWDDFWAFVEDVGERPFCSRLRRRNAREPWGPENCYWTKPIDKPAGVKVKDAEYQRLWRRRNVDKAKGYDLKRKYGITLADYDRMLEEQSGNCAICGEKDSSFGRLVVDHCHNSKVVRGLLCNECNRAIGLLGDDPARAIRLAEYLGKDRP